MAQILVVATPAQLATQEAIRQAAVAKLLTGGVVAGKAMVGLALGSVIIFGAAVCIGAIAICNEK